jgi:hypothetical protein
MIGHVTWYLSIVPLFRHIGCIMWHFFSFYAFVRLIECISHLLVRVIRPIHSRYWNIPEWPLLTFGAYFQLNKIEGRYRLVLSQWRMAAMAVISVMVSRAYPAALLIVAEKALLRFFWQPTPHTLISPWLLTYASLATWNIWVVISNIDTII